MERIKASSGVAQLQNERVAVAETKGHLQLQRQKSMPAEEEVGEGAELSIEKREADGKHG